MKITVVGSGTIVPDPERVCAGYYVETGTHRLLLDCGPGTLHHLARFGLPWDRLTHVALSHFHTDHIGDLPSLLFALKYGLAVPRRDELTILGPAGTGDLLERLGTAFGDYITDPGFPLRSQDLRSGEVVELDQGRIRLRVHATPHTAASIAYRIETPAGTLGYTGDTGFSRELGEFLQGVDLLIAECSLPDEQAMDAHLTPTRVAALASLARPGRLLLTHVYPVFHGRDLVALVRDGGWDGEPHVAIAGMRFEL